MAAAEVKDTPPPEKQVSIDHAKEAAAKTIQAMPASAQRETVSKEYQRVASQCGSSLPELTLGHDKDKQVALITKDGKPVEVIDEAGKTWKSDGKNIFSDGQNQRLLAPQTVDGQPAKNADGTPKYDLMPVQTRQVDNGDGTTHSVITQITDGDGRKWASADGQQFIGAAGTDGAAGQAGDQRILKDNNGTLEFTDPKGGTLSEQAIKGKEQELQNLIKSSTSPAIVFGEQSPFAPPPPDVIDGSKLNKVLENSSPELLARFDKDLNLRATMKDGMSTKDYEDMTRILDGANSNVTAHADRIFANGTDATETDSTKAEQESRRLLLQTNSGDMPKLNDDLLKRINADPAEKKQYDQYVEQHKNDPGFDSKNAALLSFSQHWSKETQDAMRLLVKGNDKLDTADGGTTPRAQLVKQALDNKDFDLFKNAVTGAPPEARAAISGADVDKAFTENRFLSSRPTAESERNLAIAHDLVAKGDVQPATLVKFSNADQAGKILAGLTPEQRNSYIQGKDNADPNNPDHQFYASMQEAIKRASGGDPVQAVKLDDEARKQDGSFVSSLASHEGRIFNDFSNQIKGDFGSLTDDQRKDLSENYTERRQQVQDMMKALDRDPKDVLDKFDQFFKKQPNAQPDSDGAAMTLLDKVRTDKANVPVVIGVEGDNGAAAFAQQAETIAKDLHRGFQDNPGLFDRLKNPQTDSEKQLAAMLKDPDNLFGDSKNEYGKVAVDGKLPLDLALTNDRGDAKRTAADLLGASPEEQKRFLSDPNYAKLGLGSSEFGSNADQKYDIMKNVLNQGKMLPEDEARAVAIGWKQPEDLKSLSGLSSDMGAGYQKKYGEDLQISLLNKFGHQDNSVNDFLSKYNNVFQKTDTLSHDTAVAGSGWASKILDGSGSMSPQQMDLAATQMADLSAKLQKQLDASPDGASPEIKAFMDSQKRLKDAIDNHQDATKQLTETVDKAVNLAVTAAIIAGTFGGASVPVLMAGIAAGGVGRYASKDELLGANWKDKDKTKDTFDLAVDTVAQLSATRLLKVAEVFKGMQAGEPLTVAARAELKMLGVDEKAIADLDALQKPKLAELPSPVAHELPAPSSVATELPRPVVPELPPPAPPISEVPLATAPAPAIAAEDAAKDAAKAALPRPTGQEVAATVPPPAAPVPTESTAASQSLAPRPQELAKVAQNLTPAELPLPAPLSLPSPSAAEILSGKANPAALAELSPKTKEFLFQMAQLGGIGAIDAKLKGQSAAEGALEWAAMGAAAHGVFAGLERAGIKVGFPEGSLKTGEVTTEGPRPEVHDSPTLTTGDGTVITRNADGTSNVNGKPTEVRYSKDGDNYTVETQKDGDVWRRFDSQHPEGKDFTRIKSEIGELEGAEGKLQKVTLNSGDRFEKQADGNWHQMHQSGDQWVATTDDARGAVKDVFPKIVEGKETLEVVYENSVRTFKDNAWTERSTAQPEPAGPVVRQEEAPAPRTEPIRTAEQNLRPVNPAEPVPPDLRGSNPPELLSPPAKPVVIEGESLPKVLPPITQAAPPVVKLPNPLEPVHIPGTADTDALSIVPSVRPVIEPVRVEPVRVEPVRVEPVRVEPNSEKLPAVGEPTLPAKIETLPAVRPQTDVVPSETAEAAAAAERARLALSPERAAIVAAQAAQLLPKAALDTTPQEVAKTPEKQPEVAPIVPPPTPADRPPLEPSATLAALATVKNWEGPFHSADRVLQAVLGRRPTFEEVRTLTRAMQEQFKLDHNGQDIKHVGLKHGDQFITAQNAESLLGQVAKTNPELAGQMKSYMQVDQDLGTKLGRPAAIDEVRAVSSQLQHDFMAQNQLQSFAQADAQKWQTFEAAADIPKTLQTLEAGNARLQQILDTYKATGKLPPDGIISQRAFPDSAGTLRHHHHKRAAHR